MLQLHAACLSDGRASTTAATPADRTALDAQRARPQHRSTAIRRESVSFSWPASPPGLRRRRRALTRRGACAGRHRSWTPKGQKVAAPQPSVHVQLQKRSEVPAARRPRHVQRPQDVGGRRYGVRRRVVGTLAFPFQARWAGLFCSHPNRTACSNANPADRALRQRPPPCHLAHGARRRSRRGRPA